METQLRRAQTHSKNPGHRHIRGKNEHEIRRPHHQDGQRCPTKDDVLCQPPWPTKALGKTLKSCRHRRNAAAQNDVQKDTSIAGSTPDTSRSLQARPGQSRKENPKVMMKSILIYATRSLWVRGEPSPIYQCRVRQCNMDPPIK